MTTTYYLSTTAREFSRQQQLSVELPPLDGELPSLDFLVGRFYLIGQEQLDAVYDNFIHRARF